jgi:hypothetical protein
VARKMRNPSSGRYGATGAVDRHAPVGTTRNADTGRNETVELKTRGKTVRVTPAAAKVLRAAEDLRVSVSKDWK